jgi:ADP-ribosylglycohydrolase
MLSKKIIANLIAKNQQISYNSPGIANGGVHFDWYFPNLYANQNVNSDSDAALTNKISGGITYDEDLLNLLLNNKSYRENYLALTDKYFDSIGIDFRQQDESRDNVDYATAQGYKVRLSKIIESYKICMWWCDKTISDKSRLDDLNTFYNALQDRYQRIYRAFNKDITQFNKSSNSDQYGLYTLKNCFEDSYENKERGDHIKEIQVRKIYKDVFLNPAAPHIIIQQQVDNPPPAYSSDPPPAYPTVPAARESILKPPHKPLSVAAASPATLMRIRVTPSQRPTIAKEEERKDRLKGALYGQAIFDASGLTTEFLSRDQAKTFLTNVGCITYSKSKEITIDQGQIDKFLEDPYGIRKIKGNVDPYNCIEGISNPREGMGDQQRSRWRQSVPKGSPTDDTDQAMLKFFALQNARGDLESAKKNFAKYIVNWWDGDLCKDFGRSNFGLGSNTMEVMAISYQGAKQTIDEAGRKLFLDDPVARSKVIWEKNFLEQDFFTQANGALMSSSYILQYYPDSLELAQKATQELAKVTHYDPLVSAHCVAYVTMLYKLQNHQGDLSDDKYKQYLGDAFTAGEKILDDRKGDYEELINLKQSQNPGYTYDLDAEMTEWKNQMRKAIFSEIKGDKFEKWEDLELTNPQLETDVLKSKSYSTEGWYDDIGMSHRALSAGFFGLKRLREKITSGRKDKPTVFAEICLELMAQGGDADTNGAVAGSLCGSFLGFSKIPQAMINGFGRGNDGNGAGNLQYEDNTLAQVKDKELLDKIENTANQKISKLQDATVTDGTKVTPATIIKPIVFNKFNSQDNFWASHIRQSDGYRRGNDYLVFDGNLKKPQGNLDIDAIEKAMAEAILTCQMSLGMTRSEVMRAITLAKKYGGLGNVDDSELLKDPLLTEVASDQNPQAKLLNQFRKFSSMVQKLNGENGIYSGRKDGKLVGLRLTFVSEDAIRLWQKNIHFTIRPQGGGARRGGGAGSGR